MYLIWVNKFWYLTILLHSTFKVPTYKIKPTPEHPHINKNRRTKAKNLMMKSFQYCKTRMIFT